MAYSPGSVVELTATFTTPSGDPVDPDTVYADIFSPHEKVLDNGIPTRISTGFYKFDLALAPDAQLGLWRIEWQAIIDGLNAFGHEVFEVAPAGVIVEPSDSIARSRLRSRLAEVKTDPDGDGSETFFSDSEITDLLSYAGNDLDGATLEGWRRKMARYARLVDVSESGSDRKMSQKFKQAAAMVKFWGDLAGASQEERSAALAGRIVGQAVNLRNDNREALLTPFSRYSDHIRAYPTHRLLIPAILS